MDTVQEEPVGEIKEAESFEVLPYSPSGRMTGDSLDVEGQRHVNNSSRRPSAIIAALRRPSQTLALTAAHTVMHQRRLVIELLQKDIEGEGKEKKELTEKERKKLRENRRLSNDALTIALSALYAKLIVVMGIAFPVTEIISLRIPSSFYQGFYLYLYSGSVIFVIFMYATLIREKSLSTLLNSVNPKDKPTYSPKREVRPVVRYGSFYLRLGAIAFGIGSMVYSGLEFGQYFELKKESHCHNVLIALTPLARMVLAIAQMQFIFLNSKEMELNRYKMAARFGMMHMIATNMCEWLYVLVEETKHEIVHLQEGIMSTDSPISLPELLTINDTAVNDTHNAGSVTRHDIYECKRTNIMGSLVQNASPFLFPCTIEYSLICAVILFEMWKNINTKSEDDSKTKKAALSSSIRSRPGKSRESSMTQEKLAQHFTYLFSGGRARRSSNQISVDCAKAHRGLFAGIFIVVMTIISLIMFFVLNKDPALHSMAILEVNICELVLYILTLVGVVVAMYQMRDLKYYRKKGCHTSTLGLDTTLLVMAQAGVFIYCMFSIIGCYFVISDSDGSGVIGLLAELFSLIQTVVQTMFVLDAWWRRCRSEEQARVKPGRQVVTFLIVANMAMWTINTLEKNRAQFRPTHLKFFGVWAWTIITHVSMPMAIFYRFHSTICLFEIWKSGYKMKPEYLPSN